MSEVEAPPPCVSLPAVVVGGRLGLPVTPWTSPLVEVGPPVMPDTTAVSPDEEVTLDVVTDVDGVDAVVTIVIGVDAVVLWVVSVDCVVPVDSVLWVDVALLDAELLEEKVCGT